MDSSSKSAAGDIDSAKAHSHSSLPPPTIHEGMDDDILTQHYPGGGTHEDPFLIDWLPNDRDNALNLSTARKWAISFPQALTLFTVTFGSSLYASGVIQVIRTLDVSEEVAILGLSLYVLGFAVGPVLWGPLSEVYGRKITFLTTYAAYMAFTIAVPFSPNITALLVLRFFAGTFGSSTQTNPGGMISDLFSKEDRGAILAIFAACPFLGPSLGPITGGFVAAAGGWPWLLGMNAIISGVVWIIAMFTVRETYAPYILQARARKLSKITGKVYVPWLSANQLPKTLAQEMSISLTRPWILLVREPIVLLTTLYISIVYGILYLFFATVPIVFQLTRGWSQGLTGLPFIGIAVGVFIGVIIAGVDTKSYKRLSAAASAEGRVLEPEARLKGSMLGAILLPIGLFLFAWTTYPSVHWIAPVIGIVIFTVGLMLVFISLITYIVDAYGIYTASALSANAIMRALFAFAFPLFTVQMYANLGPQWASSVPAFLVLGCLPFPFLFYRFGPKIRSKCKFAAEAAKMMQDMEQRRRAAVNGQEKA